MLSQYRELEREAHELSKQIKGLSDDNTVDSQTLHMYKNSVREVLESPAAKVAFPVAVTRELAEVEAFHTKVVENMKQFLLSETDRLAAELSGENGVGAQT